MIRQCVILAGGKGTRLGELALRVPKAMVPVAGRPMLQHHLEWCQRHGMDKVLVCAGHLGEQIAAFVGAGSWGTMDVQVMIEPSPLGTSGALPGLSAILDESFLVLYGDVFVAFDPTALIQTHLISGAVATLLTRASDHPWDSHLVEVDDGGRVREFVAQREPGRLYRNRANAAVYACSRSVLDFIPKEGASDFGADVFPAALAAGSQLAVCELRPPGFVKDMGTPERLRALESWLEERDWIEQARGAHEAVRTVFLDRDGTLNREDKPVLRPDDLVLLPGAAEAVKRFNEAGIRVVVVTNQAVVARGLCTADDVEAVHERLEEALAKNGAHLDAVYYSPYHPETHHGEGVPELRRASRCRKPDVGMLMRAVRELGVDLRSSVLVGNTATDIETARNAGIHGILVEAPTPEPDDQQPDAWFPTLLDAARVIVEQSANAMKAAG